MADDDLRAQLVDLIDNAAAPVTFDEVRARGVAPRRARGRTASLIAVAAVLMVALGAAVVLTRDLDTTDSPTPPVATAPTSSSVAPTGDPVDALPNLPAAAVEAFDLPSDLRIYSAFADRDSLLFVANRDSCDAPCPGLWRLDAKSGGSEGVGTSPPSGIDAAFDGDDVWMLASNPNGSPQRVVKVDASTGRLVYTVQVPGTHVFGNTNPRGRIAVGFGSVWVYEGNDFVARLDAETGRQTARVELPPNTASNGLAVNTHGVWSVAWGGTSVTRIDPATNRASIATNFAPGFAQSIAATDGAVWTTNVVKQLDLYRLDVVHEPVDQERAKVPTATVAAGDGDVWFLGWIPGEKIADPENHPGLVGQIDPETLAVTGVTELPIGAIDEVKLVVGGDAAWVVDATTHRAWRIDAGD